MNIKSYCILPLALFALAFPALAGSLSELPDGAAIKLLPDGGFQVTAIGTGTYDFNDPDDINGARKEAEMKAKAAIAKFLNEDIKTEEGFAEASKKAKTSTSDGTNTTTSVSKTSVKETMTAIQNSASALLSGVVVLKAEKEAAGEGGTYRVQVGVSSKTTQAAGAAAGAMSAPGASTPAGGSSGAEADATPTATSADGGAAAGGGADAAVPEGWTLCIGVGSDRKAAVQQALVEGVSQVYGQMLQNDERMSERMTKLKASTSVDGETKTNVGRVSVKESQSQTVTKTAGFVREYRIVKVEPKDGSQEATVHALIVNPRGGGTKALKVKKPTMRVADKATIYQLGPETRMSGAEIIKAIQFTVPNGLANANKFLIITDNSLGAVIENKAETEAMVAAGLASASELMQCGQGLTADYTLETEIMDVKYSSKLGQDKKTKKFGKMSKLSVKMNVTLTDARSGQQVKSDVITIALDNDEIKGLLEEDEDVDLFQAALSKLAEPLEEWMKK